MSYQRIIVFIIQKLMDFSPKLKTENALLGQNDFAGWLSDFDFRLSHDGLTASTKARATLLLFWAKTILPKKSLLSRIIQITVKKLVYI